MQLSNYVNTFGQYLLKKYGRRVHKIALNADFTCPNRDGSKGRGGCSFCNNTSFNPYNKQIPSIAQQIESGRITIPKRTGAERYIAYFQAYTNTYADVVTLKNRYDQVLAEPDVIGLSIGTRPDCVPNSVLQLLADYQTDGKEIYLELGLQSAFDKTLARVNRGHGFAEYADAIKRARRYNLNICCHLIVGLPGEQTEHSLISLQRVLDLGVHGLKIHPLHVVKNTLLAYEWKHGRYEPLSMQDYVDTACQIVLQTPKDIVFHRLTGTAGKDILLAPSWCGNKWPALNAITKQLAAHFDSNTKNTKVDHGTRLSCG